MRAEYFDLKRQCFDHPLWTAFSTWMQDTGRWERHWRWADGYAGNGRYNWSNAWECFVAGAANQEGAK